jgi:hypothetical protein
MILATSGIMASQIVSVDPDWLAYYNRVIAAGGSLTTTEQSATLQLVLDLKANSLWTPMKAIYPMVGASAAACAQNLKSSSFTGTFSSGWTFSSTGVTPNGTSAYMDTGFNASTQFSSLDSNHLSFYSRTNSTGGGGFPSEMGSIAVSGTQDLELICGRLSPLNTMTYVANNYTDNLLSASNGGNTLGFFNGSRNSSTSLKIYKNGSLGGTLTTSRSQGYNNCNIGLSVLIQSNGNPNTATYSNKQCAFSSIGDGLTDTQASNFYTAVQAFQVSLSRSV